MTPYYKPNFQRRIRNLADSVFSAYFDIRLSGREKLPDKGPFIFSFNHVHLLDSFIIGSFEGRIKYALSKKEHFYPVLRYALRAIGALPVNTKPDKERFAELTTNYSLLFPWHKRKAFLEELNSYLSDDEKLESLETLDYKLMTKYIMKRGEGLLIHLPGTRTMSYEKITNPKKGSARITLDAYVNEGIKVNLIPGGIVYSRDYEPLITRKVLPPFKTRVDISFGEPLRVEDFSEHYKKDASKAVTELTELINNEVDKHVKEIIDRLNAISRQKNRK